MYISTRHLRGLLSTHQTDLFSLFSSKFWFIFFSLAVSWLSWFIPIFPLCVFNWRSGSFIELNVGSHIYSNGKQKQRRQRLGRSQLVSPYHHLLIPGVGAKHSFVLKGDKRLIILSQTWVTWAWQHNFDYPDCRTRVPSRAIPQIHQWIQQVGTQQKSGENYATDVRCYLMTFLNLAL